eukprot:gene2749-4289_t
MAQPRPDWPTLVRVFLSTITTPTEGKVLVSVWGSFLVLSLVILPIRNAARRRVRKQKKLEAAADDGSKAARARLAKQAMSALWDILKKRTFSKHTLYLIMYVISLCTRILITVKLTDDVSKLGSYMGSRNWHGMFTGQARLGLTFMVASGATAGMKFFEKRVAISLRHILYSDLLSKYLNDKMAYYHSAAAVSDAPARLTTELEDFCQTAVGVMGHILKPMIDVVHLSFVITRRIGLPSLAIFLTFFAASQKMLKGCFDALPRTLKTLAMEKSELEANLRSHHEQLFTYREQIALQGGTAREKEALEKRYFQLQRHQKRIMVTYLVVDVLNNYVLKYGGAMCGFSVMIPGVFMGDPSIPADKVTASYLGGSILLQTLATAVKDLVEAITEVPKVQGLSTRIVELLTSIEQANLDSAAIDTVTRCTPEEVIVLSKLTIIPPKRNPDDDDPLPLVTNLDLTVKKGQHTVIRGPNGIGKTSLFRTICGLWKPHGTPAKLAMPKGSYFAVSQDGYFPGNTTLRGQIAYPGDESEISTERARELLEEVGLGHLVDSVADGTTEWRAVLSGGQKQRLSWARMLHHAPVFALIDEGTSAVDPQGAVQLHEAATKAGITLLSVSHHPAVDSHHKIALDFKGGGDYTISDITPQQ